jgi:deoxyadenosine/deoxycytidine kinase
MPRVYATIQGNIGGGKSTLVARLQQLYGKETKICFLHEPVTVWETITDENGTTMLELYYSDQNKYAFTFQMMAYISRLAALRQAVSQGYDVIVAERSLETDKNVFAKMLYDDKKISEVEYKVYTKWFEEFKQDFPEEHIIYLRTSPKVALERVNKRGRQGETIPLKYLERCHQYHEDWLISKNPHPNTLTLDADIDHDESPTTIDWWAVEIAEFLKI